MVIKVVVDDQPYIYSVDDLRLVGDEAASVLWTGRPVEQTLSSGEAHKYEITLEAGQVLL